MQREKKDKPSTKVSSCSQHKMCFVPKKALKLRFHIKLRLNFETWNFSFNVVIRCADMNSKNDSKDVDKVKYF